MLKEAKEGAGARGGGGGREQKRNGDRYRQTDIQTGENEVGTWIHGKFLITV